MKTSVLKPNKKSKSQLFNPNALRMAKTLLSFGCSECSRVKLDCFFFFCFFFHRNQGIRAVWPFVFVYHIYSAIKRIFPTLD